MPLSSNVILGKLFNFSEPQFSQLSKQCSSANEGIVRIKLIDVIGESSQVVVGDLKKCIKVIS